MNEAKTIEQQYIDQVADMRTNKSTRQLSPNTTKDYISAYRKLKSILGEDITSCFHDYEDNKEKLEAHGLKPSRIRNLFNAYINLMYAHNIPKETTSKYQEYLKNHQEAYMKSQKTNELTSQSQIDNMITYGELLDYITKLKTTIKTTKFTDRIHYQQVLFILEISKITPYRINEFAHMMYIKNADYNKMKAEEKNQHNWLVKKGWDYFIHFKQYETTKQRPIKIQKIDKSLARIIRKFIGDNISYDECFGDTASQGDQLSKFFLDDHVPCSLFHNQSPEQLSKLMIKVSKEVIGKNVGSAILRKVVVSHKYQTLKHQTSDQEAFAKSIGHSLAVENLIYNKNIGE